MGWPEELRRYSQHLDKVGLALEHKVPWPGNYTPGESLGKMPAQYRQDAAELLTRTNELAAQLKGQMATVEKVLRQSEMRDPGGRVVLLDVLG